MSELSVVIITRNEEKNILRCLESVKPVADEIVVVDSMSADRTVYLCREFGCKVIQREFDGYGRQKQYAADQAKYDWILTLDADEVVTEELQKEINILLCRTLPSKFRIQGPGSRIPEPAFLPGLHSAYRIQTSLFYMGRILSHGGVGNEFHMRLFDRKKGKFTTVPVHEGIETDGKVGNLKGRIIHNSYRDISHHLEKINHYTTLAAEGNRIRGRSFSRLWAAFKFPAVFFIFYILKLGFLDGYPGFLWSFMAAVHTTLKVAKTIELNSKP
jgi:glycosyltransferase involved in cell wall biosynthesis